MDRDTIVLWTTIIQMVCSFLAVIVIAVQRHTFQMLVKINDRQSAHIDELLSHICQQVEYDFLDDEDEDESNE